jgi:alpha-L-fucosidase
LNGRLKTYGDYQTPEQNMPVTRPEKKAWELCMTTNNNWGYRPSDTAWKTPGEVISVFCEVISMGGNLLLDIGPTADGTVPEAQVHVLKTLGNWIRKHEPSVYESSEGLPYGHYHGASTLSRDSQTVYLFVPSVQLKKENNDKSSHLPIMVKGLRSGIRSCRVLGTTQQLAPKIVGKISWSSVPGTVFIDVPLSSMDPYMTVVEVQLDGPLQLYRGQGGFQ